MRKWEAILDEALIGKAKQILNTIEDKIITQLNNETLFDLNRGLAGQLIFLSEYSTKQIDFEAVVDNMYNMLSDKTDLHGGLMSGLAGTGFSLKIINDKRRLFDEEIFIEQKQSIEKLAIFKINETDFDFVNGCLGMCLFLIECIDKKDLDLDIIKFIVENLSATAVDMPTGIAWLNPKDRDVYMEDGKINSSKGFDLGIAHGSAGKILMLSKLNFLYPELNLKDMINKAIAYLVGEESEENKIMNGYYYRSYSGEIGERFKGMLGWCYSDLGISLLYYHFWQTNGDETFLKRANTIAFFCAQKTMENNPVNSSGLCHGVAGIAHIFNRIYQITKDKTFKTAANYWYNVLFEKFIVLPKENDFIQGISYSNSDNKNIYIDNGFLEGLSGIGLSVQAALSDTIPSWDKLMLMS